MNYIYIYIKPGSIALSEEKGKESLIKIGESKNKIELNKGRVHSQNSNTSDYDKSLREYKILYTTEAIKENGSFFSDRDIHKILKIKGVEQGTGAQEWFFISVEKVVYLIEQIKKGKRPEEIDINRFKNFSMRDEQKDAVNKTKDYFYSNNQDEPLNFLWNAKMRFGKTFAAYQLAKTMDLDKILILTYKPAVHKQWQRDFEEHIDFKEYNFLSYQNGTMNGLNQSYKEVVFVSFQDLVRTDSDNKIKEKHKDLYDVDWDIVIIDEFHYGTNTELAKNIFIPKELEEKDNIDNAERKELLENIKKEQKLLEKASSIKTKYKLYLSGTPFKALANDTFSEDAIFNWTYVDEQKAKEEYEGDNNPYASLPKIELYVYKISKELEDIATNSGNDEFSLNLFFKAKRAGVNGSSSFFEIESKNTNSSVNIWLDDISGLRKKNQTIQDEINEEIQELNQQFPFDIDSPFEKELNHTLWYMPNVASVLAMEKLLNAHRIFRHYKVIPVVGGRSKSGAAALPPVEKAIRENDRTITLTCGMLTTGISVPEWSAVLFLRDIKSPESYFQTAFRAQTPYKDIKGNILKEKCYIFDFSPNRSLKLLVEYSEKLSKKSKKSTIEDPSKQKITEFIKYLPVLKISGNEMKPLDATDILKFEYDKLDSIGLGQKFSSSKNIILTDEVMESMLAGNDSEHFKEIFDKVKKYTQYLGVKENNKKEVNLDKLDQSNGIIKAAKGRKAQAILDENDKELSSIDKELKKEEKERNKEKDKIRELLKTLLSRIPLFMYLTDASEENLEDVMINTERNLFRQATGIETDDFIFLVEKGLIDISNIEGYILKYKEFEDENYENLNEFIKGE